MDENLYRIFKYFFIRNVYNYHTYYTFNSNGKYSLKTFVKGIKRDDLFDLPLPYLLSVDNITHIHRLYSNGNPLSLKNIDCSLYVGDSLYTSSTNSMFRKLLAGDSGIKMLRRIDIGRKSYYISPGNLFDIDFNPMMHIRACGTFKDTQNGYVFSINTLNIYISPELACSRDTICKNIISILTLENLESILTYQLSNHIHNKLIADNLSVNIMLGGFKKYFLPIDKPNMKDTINATIEDIIDKNIDNIVDYIC